MQLTEIELNVLQVAIDHMEEHLFIIYEAGDITLDTYELRDDAVRSLKTKLNDIAWFNRYKK